MPSCPLLRLLEHVGSDAVLHQVRLPPTADTCSSPPDETAHLAATPTGRDAQEEQPVMGKRDEKSQHLYDLYKSFVQINERTT